MKQYITPTTLGRFFGIHGNKLKSLHTKLNKNNEAFFDQKTGIWYYDLAAVMANNTPKKPIPTELISSRILI